MDTRRTLHNHALRIIAEIDRPRRQQNARSGWDGDHGRDADARTARSTAVNCAASSTPGTTRTTAPASLTSMTAAVEAVRGTGAGTIVSVAIGTKAGIADAEVGIGPAPASTRAARRQVNTCCEQTCQRRATSDTRAPGTSVSSTIRAFSSADQRRRRPGPVSVRPETS